MRASINVGLILIIAISIGFSQQQMKTVTIGPGGEKKVSTTLADGSQPFHLPELSAMVVENEGKLTVEHVMEEGMRPKGYEKTDVGVGDVLAMMNGKKISSINDLKERYEHVPVGETVKLGIKRGEQMMIASFVKADPEKLPKVRMMINRGGPDEDIIGLPQVGLLLGSKGKKVVVKRLLPNAEKELAGIDVKEGDEITNLNGNSIESFKDFEAGYAKLAAGDKVELIADRKGKTSTISFTKPKDDGRVVIRRNGN